MRADIATVAEYRKLVGDLEKLAQVLDYMAAQCDGGALPECPIIDTLLEST